MNSKEKLFMFLVKAKKLIATNRMCPLRQVINYKSFDLATSSYKECCQMLDECETTLCATPDTSIPIHMLVNCAGMAICGNSLSLASRRSVHCFVFFCSLCLGTIEETSIEDAHKMMDLNYFGTYYPTRHCLAKMKERRNGIIVITSSQAALMGIYGYGAYGAAKFALRALAETIAMEASHCGVSVSSEGFIFNSPNDRTFFFCFLKGYVGLTCRHRYSRLCGRRENQTQGNENNFK